MKVQLRYKMNGKLWGLKQNISIKEAKELYNKQLKDNPLVTEVYLIRFSGWFWRRFKTLKGEK